MYRSSTGNLDHYDDPPRGGERWDRDRFESMRRKGGGGGSRAGGPDDYEHFRFREHDRYPGGHRDIDFHEDRARQGSRVMERERFHEDDRFDRRGRGDLFHEPTPAEVANQALAPYRRKSIIDQDVDIRIQERESRRPQRPQYIRRQSSLDTYDRRPMPKYGDMERYERGQREYRLPPGVPIPLPIRERRRSPPRHYREEEDFEDVRFGYDDRSSRGREREEYREVEVSREKSKHRRSKSVAKSTRSSSISSFEEIQPPRATWGKKGKTRLPKRLVKKQAVIDLGYPFQEEEDFIIVTRALEKEHIDEVIKISENYKEEKTTYVYEEKVEEVAAPPPPPSVIAPPPPPPPPPVMHNPPPPATIYAPSERAPSPSIHEHERFVEIERSAGIHGPATAFLPEGRQLVRRRSERDIRDEIRMLEEERRMLKYERDGDFEIIETRPAKREVIRVDKDRKVIRRDRPNPKIVAAMMSTLT